MPVCPAPPARQLALDGVVQDAMTRTRGCRPGQLALLMAFDRVYVGARYPYPSGVAPGLAEGAPAAILGGSVARPLADFTRARLLRSSLAGLVERPGTAGR